MFLAWNLTYINFGLGGIWFTDNFKILELHLKGVLKYNFMHYFL